MELIFRRIKNFSLITWLMFFGYIALIGYFHFVDIYHQHFFLIGPSIVIYNICRLFFILYLIWLFYAAGDLILWHLAKHEYRDKITLESALLAFFSGVGIWHIILLGIGIAGYYTFFTMFFMTTVLFAIALPRLDAIIRFITAKKMSVYWPGWLTLSIPLSLFLITKGLYPAGGHDYYNHYFHFYRKVIETGSILPNEVWYHFYYCKGAGLYFLSMLLTDPLAPQLATTAMIFAGAGVIYSILNRSAPWRLLPWIGAALYIAFLIYTPGPIENMREGGWGDLEKPHEPAAILMLGVLWLTIGLARNVSIRAWGVALGLSAGALVLISPMLSIFVGFYLGGCAVCFFICKKRIALFWTIIGIVSTTLFFIFLLTINYIFSGVPEDKALLAFWPIVNFDKVKEWGVLYELLIIHWLKTDLIATQLPLNKAFIIKIINYLRLDIWGPLFLLSIILFGISISRQKWRQVTLSKLDKTAINICGGFLLLTILLSMIIGRDQPASFYRFTTFSYAPTLCVCLLLLASVLRKWVIGIAAIMIGFYLSWSMIKPMINPHKENVKFIIANGIRFSTGQYSLKNAYQHQEGWPGRMPWGGIYPASEQVWKLLPPRTRIWSLHIHNYCMLPDCYMEEFISYRFSPHITAIYFGQPKEAKAWLKKEGLNYFFFSASLALSDPLPLTALFSPQHISDYLGIIWTDGESFLLTWKENAKTPIDAHWLKLYQQQIAASTLIKSFPYAEMHTALTTIQNKRRSTTSDLPWHL